MSGREQTGRRIRPEGRPVAAPAHGQLQRVGHGDQQPEQSTANSGVADQLPGPGDKRCEEGEPGDQPAEEPQEPQVVELIHPRFEPYVVFGRAALRLASFGVGSHPEPGKVLPLWFLGPAQVGGAIGHQQIGAVRAARPHREHQWGFAFDVERLRISAGGQKLVHS